MKIWLWYNIRLMLRLWIVFVFSACHAPGVWGAPPEVEAHVMSGIEAIYRMDFDGAERGFDQAKAASPAYPYSYLGQAMVSWARYVYASQQTDKALKARFESDVNKAVSVSRAWLKKLPDDAEGYLALSGAYGLRSRLLATRRRWVRALLDARKAIKFVRRAHRLDPELHDALLGIGMYDYYADALPRFVKIFSKLLLGGDRKRAIGELRIVAEKGKYSDIAAQLLLIEIYTEDRWGEKDPQKALALIETLRKRFPESPVFHQVEHVCLYEAGEYERLLASAADYQQRIDAGLEYYRKSERARMFVTAGTAHFARKDFAAAQKAFASAAELAGTREKPARWGVWGLIRLGQVQDVLALRDTAVQSYKAALAFPDIWGFREAAKTGKRAPWSLSEGIGQLPPP